MTLPSDFAADTKLIRYTILNGRNGINQKYKLQIFFCLAYPSKQVLEHCQHFSLDSFSFHFVVCLTGFR